MFKDLLVFIRQFFLPEFLFTQFCLIAQRTDDTLRNIRARLKFHDTDIVHIAPQGLLAVEIEVPAVEEFVAHDLTCNHPTKATDHFFTFIRMKVCFPFFGAHDSLREDIAIELLDISVANGKAYHIAGTDLHSLFHHLAREISLVQAFTHTPYYNAVLDEHSQKGQRYQHT